MNNLFDINGGFYGFLMKIYQLILLTILWTLTSLPLVTIGASNTALYACWFRIFSVKFDGHLVRTYFKIFRSNFKKATVIWSAFLALLLLTSLFYPLLAQLVKTLPILVAPFVLLLALVALTYVYLWPLLAHFDNTVKGTLKNAFFISFANMAVSIILVVLNFALLVAFPIYLFKFIIIWLFTGQGLASLLTVLILRQVFKKYEKKEDL